MKTVVAVEDDKGLADMLARALREYGYDLQTAQCVKGAFERIRTARPAFVFLDVMLPDGAGYQIARRIRMDPELFRMPIMYVSSLGEEPEIQHAMHQGGDIYLPKPFTLKQLLEKIAMLEELVRRIAYVSSTTQMPSLEALERDIDYRMLHGIPFDLCLITINNYREYVISRGKDLGLAVLQWVADMLRGALRDLKIHDARLAHIGTHQFLALLPPESAKAFCKGVRFDFSRKLPEFYKDFELQAGHIVVTKHPGTFSGYSLMELEVEALELKPEDHATAVDIIHCLGKIHRESQHNQHKTLFRFDQYKKW